MAFKNPSYNSFTHRHVSPSEIGRKLGLDEKTVRVRIMKMEDSGFIKYYQAMPSLALFGLKNMGTYRFEAVNIVTKHEVVNNINQALYIVEAFDYLGPSLSVTIAGISPRDVQQVADGLAKRFELNKMNLGDRVVREPLFQPDKLDWEIIQGLRYEARSATKDLAHALSITPRMVEYRITKLLDSGALLVRTVINPQRQEGLVFYELEMSVEEAKQPTVIKRLKETYGEKLWSWHTSTADLILVNLFSFTLREPEETVMNTLKLDGVRLCLLFILKEIIEPRRPNWMDNLIKQKIESERSRRN